MIDTGAPTKLKSDKVCPFFYECNSWGSQQIVPWNDADKRVMYPSLYTLLDLEIILLWCKIDIVFVDA